MSHPSGWFRTDNLLPVENVIFQSAIVNIGTFRCAAESDWFLDRGPIANHVFVFPRTAIGLEMAGRSRFVSSPNITIFYNRGQEYRRFSLATREPDHCDWIAIAPEVLFDIVGQFDPDVVARGDRPFTMDYLPSPPRAYAAQRSLIEEVIRGTAEPLQVEEMFLGILATILAQAASTDRRFLQSPTQKRVEKAKEILAADLSRSLSVRHVAEAIGVSVYHLCKIFRQSTGYSMHQFRRNLRLRHSLARVLDGEDILTTAIDLGFYGHSHFTQAFRTAFGVTPSEFRRRNVRRSSMTGMHMNTA